MIQIYNNEEITQNDFPKVSIIVPIYNVKDYLGQCIDSLITQTYENIEIILVDDGSTDESGEICEKYAKQDERIIVLHQENKGPGFAREYGVATASGAYVLFVDGDDWIDTDTIEICMKVVLRYKTLDSVIFSYIKEYPAHSVPMHIFNGTLYLKKHEARHKVYRRLFGLYGNEMAHPEQMESMSSCWMRLYTIENAQKGRAFNLNEIGSSEDALFNMYALADVRDVLYINKCFYHYRKRTDSITNAFRPDLPGQWKHLFKIMMEIIKEKGLDATYKKALSNRIALSITAISLNEINNASHTMPQKIKAIHEYLNDHEYVENCRKVSINYLPFIWKIYIICAKLKLAVPIYLMSCAITLFRKI